MKLGLRCSVVTTLLACGRGEGAHSGGSGSLTDATCPDGQLLDGERCVPADCGQGTWGALELDAPAIYVDAAAEDGGDGSIDAPLTRVDEALELAEDEEVARVLLAAGVYDGPLTLKSSLDGLTIAGRCAALVNLAGDGESPTLLLEPGRGEPGAGLALEGVTVTGGYYGVVVTEGSLSLESVVLSDNTVVGLEMEGELSLVSVHEVQVLRTAVGEGRMASSSAGVLVASGARLEGAGLELEGNGRVGLLVDGEGSAVELEDLIVTATEPLDSGAYGLGVYAQQGAALTLLRASVDLNTSVGVGIVAASADLAELTVTSTSSDGDGALGRGVSAESGAVVAIRASAIQDNQEYGLYASGEGTQVTLIDATVAGTAPSGAGEHGEGARVQDGAKLVVSGSVFADNATNGVIVNGEGSELSLTRSEVRETACSDAIGEGIGVLIGGGAAVEIQDSSLVENCGDGLGVTDLGSTATASGTELSRNWAASSTVDASGAHAVDGASLTLIDCELSENRGFGVSASGAGTLVALDASLIRDTRAREDGGGGGGVGVLDGASLVVTDSRVQGSQNLGIWVSGVGSAADLDGVEIVDVARDGDVLALGVQADEGARLSMRSSTVQGVEGIGVGVAGSGTRATLEDLRVLDIRASPKLVVGVGVVAQLDASLVAGGLEVRGVEGPALYVLAASLSCGGCALTEAEVAGAVVMNGGELTLRATTIEDTGLGTFGTGYGVLAFPGGFVAPTLLLDQVAVRGSGLTSVFLKGYGSYQILDSDLEGGTALDWPDIWPVGNAIFATERVRAWDGENGLLVEGCTLHDSEGGAVFLDGASATLLDNTWSNNTLDLIQQRCDGLDAPEGADEVPDRQVCPETEGSTRRVETADFYLFFPDDAFDFED